MRKGCPPIDQRACQNAHLHAEPGESGVSFGVWLINDCAELDQRLQRGLVREQVVAAGRIPMGDTDVFLDAVVVAAKGEFGLDKQPELLD